MDEGFGGDVGIVGWKRIKSRLWGIEGGSVANGMRQVGACNRWDRCQEGMHPLVGAQFLRPHQLMDEL